MTDREPNLVTSGLSGPFEKDGIKVEVWIGKLEHEQRWSLEVVNSKGTSTVWDDLFDTDEAAYTEFARTIDEEGISTFLDNVIPFRR